MTSYSNYSFESNKTRLKDHMQKNLRKQKTTRAKAKENAAERTQ